MESQSCPHCNARLYNPAPGRDGVLRCSSCGTPISGTTGTGTALGVAARRAEESVPHPEPKPASYAFLAALGYALALLSVVLAFYSASWVWIDRVPWSSRGSGALWNQVIFIATPFVLVALGAVVLHVCLLPRRLDLAALRLAARHIELRGLKFPAPRSSLDIFGPFLVIGGLVGIYALMMVVKGESLTWGRELPGVLMGVGLFVFGLALADVHRLLWRLEWLAQQMSAGRNFPPQSPGFMRSLRHAFPLVILAAGVLCLKTCLDSAGYGMRYGGFEGSLLVMVLCFLACWSLYRLSVQALACLETWGLVGSVHGRNFADRASRYWGTATLIAGLLIAFCLPNSWSRWMGVYPGSTVMVMQWAVLLYLAIGPALLQYAAAIARDLSAGRPSAARFGLPRGWVSLACAVILFGGILGSVRTVAEFFPYFIGSNYMAILFLFPAGTMPLAGAVWVVGLLSPIHFLVVNLEAASEQGSQNG